MNSTVRRLIVSVSILLLSAGSLLRAAPTDPWTRGTGLFSSINLGALQNPAVINRTWPLVVNYDLNLNTWAYDVYVPPNYDATKPYGVVVFITSDAVTGIVLQTASNDKNIIWIAPRYVGNGANSTDRHGAALLAAYRAKELFNIDPRRVYLSGKSGGARTASSLAYYHSEVFHGVAPSSGFALPRLNEVTPDYITNTSGQTDTYFDYSDQPFNYYFYSYPTIHASIEAAGRTNKLRSYIMTRYDDYREDYFVEGFHCAFEPQGHICFLYDGPGGHQDPSDAEMDEAIDYLDRDDIFPVNANTTAGAGGFAGMTNISQSGASAVEATTGNGQNAVTTYTLTPTLTAVAAAKSKSKFYWDNANGSTVRWLWEVQNAAPTNQKTCFGLWFADETWNGGVPVAVTNGTNPGILITITQNGSLNRLVISARPDSGGETVFYDGYFSFVPAYSTAWTSTQTGYLTGTGSPVEIRMDVNKSRWQLTFNGIVLDGSINVIANGTQRSRDNKRLAFGYWDTALGHAFWNHDPNTSVLNTWSPFTKSIFTAATGALSGPGATPSPMQLRYVIASDPGLADPLPAGPSGITASAAFGTLKVTWNALAGATSYQVKRSTTSGGPYTNLASNVTGTSYTDASAQSGVLYYYTVSATTASGTTANGAESAAGLNPLRLRTTGGTASDSQNTTGTEGVAKAFDGSTATKWFNGTNATDWIQYRFAGGKRFPLSQYRISSANDVPTRDPMNWQVLGSNDGTNWTTLDAQTGQTFTARYQTITYNVPLTAAYEYYRLNITTNAGATGLQLSEWQIFSPDMVPPVISTPSDILIGTVNGSGEAVNFQATATDAEDGPVAVVCTPPSGSVFPIGTNTVVCAASDLSGNYSQTSFKVTVHDDSQSDVSPPTITIPTNITVSATGPAGAVVTFTTSALDAIDGVRPTTNTPASGSFFPIGSTVVTVTASDTKGNAASRTFTVTVQPFAQGRAWLKFDEASGTTAADATGNGWSGTLVGGPTWVAGKINRAVNLSGTSQYVTLPSGIVSNLTDFTVAAWVKQTSRASQGRIFDFGTSVTPGATTGVYMFLTPYNGSNMRFAISTSGYNNEQGINYPAISAGVWAHVAITLSGNTAVLYLNGSPVGTNSAMTLKPSSLGNTTQNYIGKSQFNDPYLNGQVDDFQVFGQALTAQQIAALAAPPAAPASITAGPGNARAVLSWGTVPGASSYNIKRALTSGGPYALVANTTATGFTDTGLTNGTTYYYVVTALSASTESANSAEASTSPYPPPLAPAGLKASSGDTLVNLSWAASAGAVSYTIKRALSNGGAYAALASGLTSTNYADTTATNGTTYYYVVVAVNAVGSSPDSSQVSAHPVSMASPTATSAMLGNQLQLNWPADHTGWRLQISTNLSMTNWQDVAGADATNAVSILPTNGNAFFRLVYP